MTLSLKTFFQKSNRIKGKFYIAFSGGLDSTVLLHLFVNQADENSLKKTTVLHINHGLSPKAKYWEQHCQGICQQLNIPMRTVAVFAKAKPGESPEAAARTARYQAFSDRLQADDVLITAHHQDDQVETHLLQLFRGAGIKGLAAMPELYIKQQLRIARPFLNVSRQQLQDYAIDNQLQWIEDESNQDLQFRRNFLRHEIIPKLKNHYPNLNKVVSRSIKHCQQANELLKELAEMDLLQARKGQQLDIVYLKTLSTARRNNCLREWILENGYLLPNEIKLQEIQNNLIAAKPDSQPIIQWGRVELRRYQNLLYIMPPLKDFDAKQTLKWKTTDILDLPTLKITLTPQIFEQNNPFLQEIPVGSEVEVRFRQGAEQMYCPQRNITKSLKKLFQEMAIPPWQRDRIPLIYFQDKLLFFYGY